MSDQTSATRCRCWGDEADVCESNARKYKNLKTMLEPAVEAAKKMRHRRRRCALAKRGHADGGGTCQACGGRTDEGVFCEKCGTMGETRVGESGKRTLPSPSPSVPGDDSTIARGCGWTRRGGLLRGPVQRGEAAGIQAVAETLKNLRLLHVPSVAESNTAPVLVRRDR
jgi:hypothetical protein